MDSFPVTEAERRGLEEQRRLRARIDPGEEGKIKFLWVWHRDKLVTIHYEGQVLIEQP